MPRQIYLLRHAKAATDDGGGDHERRLTGRGRQDATAMGREIARRGFRPKIVLCSTSQRTVETLELALPFFAPQPATKFEPSLYHADARHLVRRTGLLSDQVRSVMFVGHNPGLEELALELAGNSKLARRMGEKFPTSAFAAFESNADEWTSAVGGTWTTLDFLIPAEL